MVSIPISFANFAITGAAPVPVPPPIPAVINTISVFLRHSSISSKLNSAANFPCNGSFPAPRPLV